MAETRQIGRVEKVDVMLNEREPFLVVRFKLADEGDVVLTHPIAHATFLRDYLDVWAVDALQATDARLCWVTTEGRVVVELAPLMPDEGDTLDLREKSAAGATMPAKAPQSPATAPEADRPTPEQGARWKAAISKARTLKLDIEHCRPKPGMTRDEVEGLLSVAEATLLELSPREAA